jgi:hypothetical protein
LGKILTHNLEQQMASPSPQEFFLFRPRFEISLSSIELTSALIHLSALI